MAICMSNAAILHFDMKLAGFARPESLDHHQHDLWKTLKRFVFPNGRLLPVEVKWTEHPNEKDARHLHSFIADHANAFEGYIVCRCKHPQKISNQVTAIPWHMI